MLGSVFGIRTIRYASVPFWQRDGIWGGRRAGWGQSGRVDSLSTARILVLATTSTASSSYLALTYLMTLCVIRLQRHCSQSALFETNPFHLDLPCRPYGRSARRKSGVLPQAQSDRRYKRPCSGRSWINRGFVGRWIMNREEMADRDRKGNAVFHPQPGYLSSIAISRRRPVFGFCWIGTLLWSQF